MEVSGPTVSNIEGWGAAHAYLGQTFAGAIQRSQGLVAVQGDLRPVPRVLAATRTPSVPKGAYRPLIWGPRDVVVLESRSFPGCPRARRCGCSRGTSSVAGCPGSARSGPPGPGTARLSPARAHAV